ncbi:hypothetical protein TrVE_jg6145 [Triparma verrucosa]|uniref:Phospholipase/carboxylesterase/thioesterase domain-containing protein n=1 Tax=Triparma verrucosa TaxID=1606542 RepID=A0A9W7F087_9STRA|nr:hypothetical protein TrVE_jg6145 [Triparma verrucosa]
MASSLNLSPLNPPSSSPPPNLLYHSVVSEGSSFSSSSPVHVLSPVDEAFLRPSNPILVHLAIITSSPLDTPTFVNAVKASNLAIPLKLSSVPKTQEALLPSSSQLFPPCGSAELSIRLNHVPSASKTCIALTWDHALSDVGGVMCVLRRISVLYSGADSPLEPLPPLPPLPLPSTPVHPPLPPLPRGKSQPATLTYSYTPDQLQTLKSLTNSTSHLSIFADIILLLLSSGLPLASFSVSKSTRTEPSSVGNSTLIHSNCLPTSITLQTLTSTFASTLKTPGVPLLSRPSSIHFTSWWHPLQTKLEFHNHNHQPAFAIGDDSALAASRIVKRTGQCNVTVMPSSSGLRVTLRGPKKILIRMHEIVKACEGKPYSTPLPPLPTPTLQQQAPPATAGPLTPTSALVWLHGLGDSPSSWQRGKFPNLSPSISLHVPSAPPGPVPSQVSTENIPSWFPIPSYPLTSNNVDSRELNTAISSIHELLKSLPYPPSRIVLGGFSQGGALALAAGLCHQPPLAGIVSVSGWLPSSSCSSSLSSPFLFTCGTSDPIVPFTLAKKSGASLSALATASAANATISHVQRGSHTPKKPELEQVTAFINSYLPPHSFEEDARPLIKKASERPKSKRAKALANYRKPSPASPVPASLFSGNVLTFDLGTYDLKAALSADLGSRTLSSLYASVAPEERPAVVASDLKSLCEQYERLVRDVVAPHLRAVASDDLTEPVLYQFPPTVRAQKWCGQEVGARSESGRRMLLGPLHSDADYGHQEGEINFWLPLTDVLSNNTLWAETEAGLGDFEPVLVKCGEVFRFHGQSCRHLAVTSQNAAEGGEEARISLDFRCALKSHFDNNWEAPGLLFRHEYRTI